jgi:PAS domain S-box-containing protein
VTTPCAHWNSRDEIGRLVTAFNGMLAQLDRERLLQQELAASARAAQAQRELVEAFPIPMVVTSIPEHQVLHAAPASPGSTAGGWTLGRGPGGRRAGTLLPAAGGPGRGGRVRGALERRRRTLVGGAVGTAPAVPGQDAVLTAFTPINVLKVMEQRLELWAKVFEASSEGIIIMNAEQHIISVNKAFCRSTQYDFYEVIGESLDLLLEEREGEPLSAQIRAPWWKRNPGRARCASPPNGETYPPGSWSRRCGRSRAGGANHIGIAIDITDRKLNEERIQFLAHHDVLTELPNRSLCVLRCRRRWPRHS